MLGFGEAVMFFVEKEAQSFVRLQFPMFLAK